MKFKMRFKSINFISVFFMIVVLASFSLIILKLYKLQIVKAENNKIFGGKIKKIPPIRGNIYLQDKDGNLILAATSFYLYDLYFYPPKSKNIVKELEEISKIIDKPLKASELEKLDKAVLLEKNLSQQKKEKIEKLNLKKKLFTIIL